MISKNDKICYLCGKDKADSKDHIPPKNIFPKKTSNLLTVPAHIKCNKEHEKDDEYFLFFLSVAAFSECKEMKDLWKEKILRSLNRSESHKYKSYINDHINSVDILSEGGIILGNGEVFFAETSRINRILSKIARGVVFKEDGTYIHPSSSIEIQLMKPDIKMLRGDAFCSIGNDIFQYAWHKTDSTFYLWFIFYKCVDVWIMISSEKS